MSPVLIDDRWELHELLGVGGGGRVWRTVDRITGREAALKLVRATSTAHMARVRREIAALESLRIPGVVRLHEFGDHLGEPYLVMDLVRGRPFPGVETRLPWEALATPALRLLDVLGRVHATGIIHRDLKPANVLVDDKGRVVLLDFGLARGTPGDAGVTADGAMIGTPRYLAPEQVTGRRVDQRADLFAFGVMLYDALAGSQVFDAVSLATRLTTPHQLVVPPLEEVAPEVPAAVARVVHALLAPMPSERPSSAGEVRRALAAVAVADTEPREPLPLVTFQPLLEAVTAECLAGHDVALAGASGTGRTRFAEELAARLRAAGRVAAVTRPGSRPLTSLRGLVSEEEMLRGPGGVEEALRSRLAAGDIVIVDAVEQLDPWSRRVTERLAQTGQFVRLGVPDAPRALPPIPPEDMRAWFTGPEAFFHLPEDAARALYERTAGHPGRAVRELEAWVVAELSRRDGARHHVDRDAIDQLDGGRPLGDDAPPETRHVQDPAVEEVLAWMVLAGAVSPAQLAAAMERPDWEIEVGLGELHAAGLAAPDPDGLWRARVCPPEVLAWPEERVVAAHARLAGVWPAQRAERLRHLLCAGDLPGALACATEQATEALKRGRPGHAYGVLAPILNRMRTPDLARTADAAIGLLTHAVYVERTGTTIKAARHVLEQLPCAGARHAVRLLHILDLMAAGDAQAAVEAAELTAPFTDPELELGRRAPAALSAVRHGSTNPEVIFAEVRAAVGPAADSRLATWRGLQEYERGRYAAAAEQHAQAVATARTPFDRRLALVNLAMAAMDALQAERAAVAGAELEALGRTLRVPVLEAQGYGLRVQARYRFDEALEPVPAEVLEASRQLGHDPRHSALCLTAAAAWWRLGRPGAAQPLALEATTAWRGRPQLQVLPLALAAACGAPADLDRELRALAVAHPRIRAQGCALFALAFPDRRAELRALAALPSIADPRPVRLQVLSLAECDTFLGPSAV